MSESRALLEKAERALHAADRLLQDGDADFAASRAYYAYFYTAEALLLAHGSSFTRHGQVVARYGALFAKTGRLDPEFHQLLLRAFRLREIADYQVGVQIDGEVVQDLLEGGKRFVAAALASLDGLS